VSEQTAARVTCAVSPGVTLADFNALDRDDAAVLVRPCLDVDRWVDAVVEGRPYADLADLRQTATEASIAFSGDELEAALAHHPRIGQSVQGGSKEADLSRGEQSGLDVDDELSQRLREGNADYERRFGRVFLIRAAGRTVPEILAALGARLTNDDDAEDEVVADQLAQIALVRLNGLVTP
jgi:2-oxo-4-hydroxy-4-carboxy-5-ureidoimidazoline decarboxylase